MEKIFYSRDGIALEIVERASDQITDTNGKLPLLVCLSTQGRHTPQSPMECFSISIYPKDRLLWETDVCHAIAEYLHKYIARNLDRVDDMRIYLIGVREGAAGVWAMLAKYPRLFAAAVPVNGCGDPYAIRTVRVTPIWAFHHAADSQIDAEDGCILSGTRFIAGSWTMTLSLKGQAHPNVRLSSSSMSIVDVPLRIGMSSCNIRDWHTE